MIDATALALAPAVHERLAGRAARWSEELAQLAAIDTPSADAAGCAAAERWLWRCFAPLGTVRRVAGTDGAALLSIDIGDVAAGRAPLVLCHYDTVWEHGTAERWPLTISDGWVRGPGVLDMKGSIVMLAEAVRALSAAGVGLRRGIRVLISGDEEILNPSSADAIARFAASAGATLVLEPPLPGGELKTERKGYALVRAEVTGRAAHAGVAPQEGVSAAIESARLALAAAELNAPELGTTVNVGVLRSGSRANVVAEAGELQLDVRAASSERLDGAVAALKAVAPEHPEASIAVEVLRRREPMPRLAATATLLGVARAIAERLGTTVSEAATGGVSEANISVAAGTPTLDGLGLVGVGAHTRDEAFRLHSFADRGALLTALLTTLSNASDSALRALRAEMGPRCG